MTTPQHPGRPPRTFASPHRGSGERIDPAPAGEPHVPVAPPALLRQGRSVWLWLWFVVALCALATLGFFVTTYGAAGPAIASVLAFIPFAAVVICLMWLDRWEPEPRAMIVFAVAWGAFVAIILTFAIGLFVQSTLPFMATFTGFSSVVQAPIVEELLKCAGILVVLAMGRRALDGALDGIVYGGLIGAGFAFVENVKYFVESFLMGGVDDLTTTFFMRAVLSPFAHIMFTAACGFAVGLAVRRGRNVFGPWLVGLVVAIALHAIWNGSALFAGFFLPYLFVQIPLFALCVVAAIRIRLEELRLRRERLEEYVRAGWFTPQEADMLSTRPGRKAGLTWAATLPGDRRPMMKRFIHDGARLAWARQRALTGRDPLAAVDERALLRRMLQTRAELLAPVGR
ncbi:PrsW family intramembrane metalloprotease [Microbacterium karelineae]|uniref:PrsW family intramembrane metalloprotease n=1 Tax=Microbacterium karelineae TaxID=2654283 RepID=UPI0012E9F7CB|nr:PrsW family intramembrane metalloprotease [Microbacterium karelineae]